MVRIERTQAIGRNVAIDRASEPERPLPIVPFDPRTSGPIATKRGATTVPRIEAPWSARAKELASAAIEAAKHHETREAIAIALETILEAPELRGAKVSVAVGDEHGILFSRDADLSVNPASNAKLCTAMFALGVLGPNHRFVSEVKKHGDDLHLIGAFDPSMTTESLDRLAEELKSRGIDRAERIVLDVSRFEGSRAPAGFDRYGDQDWQYLARPEALSVNKNLLRFRVLPGSTIGSPAIVEGTQRAFEVRSTVETIAPRSKFRIGIDEIDGQPIIEVTGTIARDYAKGKELVMKSPDPLASFSDELRRAFERAGIEVGAIDIGDAPKESEPIYRHRSEPLSVLLRESIATSNAFDHEMYALAAAAKLSPSGRTSLEGARVKMERFLVEELGLGAPVMANASGIGNLDRLSANDVLKLLARASSDRRYATLLSALARPGREGTLATRMIGTAAERLLSAKTGTGDDAVALSGTIGKRHRFSVLIDDHQQRDGARAVLDAIGIALSEIAARSARASRTRR